MKFSNGYLNSIGIINEIEYRGKLKYPINYYNSIEDYTEDDDLAF